ncbi:hypothetical protein DXT97_10600 [Agrobacterium tumefaciens]|nr:hypothetical protein [Agrobacterium tumefaciens]
MILYLPQLNSGLIRQEYRNPISVQLLNELAKIKSARISRQERSLLPPPIKLQGDFKRRLTVVLELQEFGFPVSKFRKRATRYSEVNGA